MQENNFCKMSMQFNSMSIAFSMSKFFTFLTPHKKMDYEKRIGLP